MEILKSGKLKQKYAPFYLVWCQLKKHLWGYASKKVYGANLKGEGSSIA